MKFLFFSSAVWDFYHRSVSLCVALARQGHEVVFVEPMRYAGKLPAHLNPPTSFPVPSGVHVIRRDTRLHRGVAMALAQNLSNVRLVRRHRPDVAVLLDAAFGLLPALLFRFSRTKVVLDYVDDWPEWSKVAWERWLLRHVLIPTMARLADTCTVSAELLGEDLRPYARRIVLVPNGAAEVPPPLDDRALRAGEGVLYVGGLTDRIDIRLLIELARCMPDVPVTVLGDGPRLADVQAAALELPNLRASGPVSHEDAMAAMRRAAVCLVPYVPSRLTDRCSPVKLAEYWACSRAVVASDTHEVKRISNGRARLYSTTEEAVATVRALIDHPEERAALAQAGYEAARDEFNYDVLARRFLEAIQSDAGAEKKT